jgi:hypothetical protein
VLAIQTVANGEGSAAGAVGSGNPLAAASNAFALMSGTNVVVRGVWKDNCAAEFAKILHRIRRRHGRLYVAVFKGCC